MTLLIDHVSCREQDLILVLDNYHVLDVPGAAVLMAQVAQMRTLFANLREAMTTERL